MPFAQEIIKEKGRDTIRTYVYRYPQLTITPEPGRSKSEAYKDIVLRGNLPNNYTSSFSGTEEDCIFQFFTPVGEAEVLYLANRKDFETCVQVLGYKCEPKDIPASMGAIYIGGINNWRKILAHKKEYLEAGNSDWNAEFKRFTSNAKNYKDTVLLVSKGNYSMVPASEAGYSEEEWLDNSLTIRIYHELTHLVCRKQYPGKENPLRDEIVADCMGICKALGYYNTLLAEKFLGVEGAHYRGGGRLENYVKEKADLLRCHEYAKQQIHTIAGMIQGEVCDYWGLLDRIQV